MHPSALSYHGIEHRCFEIDDCMFTCDGLLAALLADEKIQEFFEYNWDHIEDPEHLAACIVRHWYESYWQCWMWCAREYWSLQLEWKEKTWIS